MPGTIMVESTESESKAELDRFIAAMTSIREEIRRIERGELTAENNPLKNAPHTQSDVINAGWDSPYSRDEAVFPLAYVAENKPGRVRTAHAEPNACSLRTPFNRPRSWMDLGDWCAMCTLHVWHVPHGGLPDGLRDGGRVAR